MTDPVTSAGGAERQAAAVAAAGAFGADVLSKLGHELRSPLVGIIGLTRLLVVRINAGSVDLPAQVRQLGLIEASAVSSLSTIEQVIELAKLESGQVRCAPLLTDARPLVDDAAGKLKAAAAERGLRLCTELPEGPVTLYTDPEILGRLLNELITNGLRYTDAHEVRIQLKAGNQLVIIDVSDDGPGIPASDQARVFEPFERGALAGESKDGAPGLGLHLARKHADLLGAQLSLTSQVGLGSTFTITLANSRASLSTKSAADPGAP